MECYVATMQFPNLCVLDRKNRAPEGVRALGAWIRTALDIVYYKKPEFGVDALFYLDFQSFVRMVVSFLSVLLFSWRG